MTTEEIMRAQAPRNLGEWAFQGFPGRSKRIRQARELAGEGMQQRLAEEAAVQDIIKARAAEMIKLQADARERQATLEHLQAMRRGDFGQANELERLNRAAELDKPYREAQINSLNENVATNRAFREAQEMYARGRAWGSLTQALTRNPQNQTQYERAGEGLIEIDPTTGSKFYIGPDPNTGAMGRVPLQVPPIGGGGGGGYLPPRSDVSTIERPNPVRAGDEQAPVAKPGIVGRALGALGFGGAPKTPSAPATVNSGWDGSKGYSEKAPVTVSEPITRGPTSPLGMLGSSTISGLGDVLSRAAFRAPMRGSSTPAEMSAEDQIGLYQQTQPYQMSPGRAMLKQLMMRDPSIDTSWDERQRQRHELRRAKAFQTLQSLYQ